MRIASLTKQTSPYPPYISINENSDGTVTIAVRSNPDGHHEGNYSIITISKDEFIDLTKQIVAYLDITV